MSGAEDHMTLLIDDMYPELNPQLQEQPEIPPYSIGDMLNNVPPSSLFPCIYRVPDSLRRVNPHSFTPRLVAIGPFHHNNPRLLPMEELKLRFFQTFLARRSNFEDKVSRITTMIEGSEEIIRRHYQEEIKLGSEDFCRMILLDAVFIVELIIKKEEKDEMFKSPWLFCDLLHDIILIENQIPLCVPDAIYQWFYLPDPNNNNFAALVRSFIKDVKDVPDSLALNPGSYVTAWGERHFVEYLMAAHVAEDRFSLYANDRTPLSSRNSSPSNPGNCSPSIARNHSLSNHEIPSSSNHKNPLTSNPRTLSTSDGAIKCWRQFCSSSLSQADPEDPSLQNPEDPSPTDIEDPSLVNPEDPLMSNNLPSLPWKFKPSTASKLFECGVKFEKLPTTVNVNIQFQQKEGILLIPQVKVNEWTETLFRNLVAFEQCHHVFPRYASDYVIFMDGLIDTPEDVDILTTNEIVEDGFEDPLKVSEMFNSLHKEVISEGRDYLFVEQSRGLNAYRRDLWHRYKAWWYKSKLGLKHDYFNSPWSVISFIAASAIVILSFVQTICSIYQAKGIKM